MVVKDFLQFLNKEKREKEKRERVKSAQKLAVGMGVVAAVGVATGIFIAPNSGKETRKDMKDKVACTVEAIKEIAIKKADKVKNAANHKAQDISNGIKDVHDKTEDVKKDIKDGFHKVKKDIDITKEKVSKDVKKS